MHRCCVSLGTDNSKLVPRGGLEWGNDTLRNQSPFSQRFLKEKKRKKRKNTKRENKEKVVFPPTQPTPLPNPPVPAPESNKIAVCLQSFIYCPLQAALRHRAGRRALRILGASTFDDRRLLSNHGDPALLTVLEDAAIDLPWLTWPSTPLIREYFKPAILYILYIYKLRSHLSVYCSFKEPSITASTIKNNWQII